MEPSQQIEIGNALLQNNLPDAAFDTALELLGQEPQGEILSQALHLKARAALRLGRPMDALSAAEEALRLDSQDVEAWCLRSAANLAKREVTRAIGDAQEALERAPSSPLAFLSRGLARARSPSTSGAVDDLQHAVDDPAFAAEALRHRGLLHAAEDRMDEAAADLVQASLGGDELASEHLAGLNYEGSADTWYAIGRWRLASGELQTAVDLLTRAMEANDSAANQGRCAVELGQASMLAGDLEAAERWLDRAMECSPEDYLVHVRRAELFLAADRDEDATVAADQAASLSHDRPSYGLALRVRARQALGRGETEEALAMATRGIENNPVDGEAFFLRALAHQRLGHDSDAREDLFRANHLGIMEAADLLKERHGVVLADTLMDEAAAAQEAGRTEDALDMATAAANTFANESRVTGDLGQRNQAAAITYRGWIHEQRDERDRAEHDYRHALDIDLGCAEAWINLGNLLDRKGQPTDAIAALGQAVALAPQDGRTYYNRGRVLVSQEKVDEAIRDFSAAIDLYAREPELRRDALRQRARAFESKGDEGKAQADLATLAEMGDEQAADDLVLIGAPAQAEPSPTPEADPAEAADSGPPEEVGEPTAAEAQGDEPRETSPETTDEPGPSEPQVEASEEVPPEPPALENLGEAPAEPQEMEASEVTPPAATEPEAPPEDPVELPSLEIPVGAAPPTSTTEAPPEATAPLPATEGDTEPPVVTAPMPATEGDTEPPVVTAPIPATEGDTEPPVVTAPMPEVPTTVDLPTPVDQAEPAVQGATGAGQDPSESPPEGPTGETPEEAPEAPRPVGAPAPHLHPRTTIGLTERIPAPHFGPTLRPHPLVLQETPSPEEPPERVRALASGHDLVAWRGAETATIVRCDPMGAYRLVEFAWGDEVEVVPLPEEATGIVALDIHHDGTGWFADRRHVYRATPRAAPTESTRIDRVWSAPGRISSLVCLLDGRVVVASRDRLTLLDPTGADLGTADLQEATFDPTGQAPGPKFAALTAHRSRALLTAEVFGGGCLFFRVEADGFEHLGNIDRAVGPSYAAGDQILLMTEAGTLEVEGLPVV